MSAPLMGTDLRPGAPVTKGAPFTKFEELKERFEMKLTNLHTKTQIFVSEVFVSKAPVKILAGVAVGAMLMTATAFPSGFVHADHPASPLTKEIAIPSHEQLVDDLGEYGRMTGSSVRAALDHFGDLGE